MGYPRRWRPRASESKIHRQALATASPRLGARSPKFWETEAIIACNILLSLRSSKMYPIGG